MELEDFRAQLLSHNEKARKSVLEEEGFKNQLKQTRERKQQLEELLTSLHLKGGKAGLLERESIPAPQPAPSLHPVPVARPQYSGEPGALESPPSRDIYEEMVRSHNASKDIAGVFSWEAPRRRAESPPL